VKKKQKKTQPKIPHGQSSSKINKKKMSAPLTHVYPTSHYHGFGHTFQ